MNARTKNGFFVAWFLACFLANVWPIALLANRIEPTIFGFPFFLCWTVSWSFLAFVGIVTLYLSTLERQD